MSPRSEEQFEAIREERKRQIAQTALELFAKEGFAKVSVAKIAAKANISKGLMYNYYSSKEDLIVEILKETFDLFTDAFKYQRGDDFDKNAIHEFIDETFRIFESNLPFWKMYFMVMFQPEVYKLIISHLEVIMGAYMERTIAYFAKCGYEDPVAEARYLGSLFDGIGLNFLMDPENFPLEYSKNKLHEMYK